MGEKHGQWGWGYVNDASYQEYHKVWYLFFIGMFELNSVKAKPKHISGIYREKNVKVEVRNKCQAVVESQKACNKRI